MAFVVTIHLDLSIGAASNARACLRESYKRRVPTLVTLIANAEEGFLRDAVVTTVQHEADAINALTVALITACGGPK